MTREDVRKVVSTLKKLELGVIDLRNPTYTTPIVRTGLSELSLNILNPPKVIKDICEDLDIE